MAWASPTVPRAAAASSSTAGAHNLQIANNRIYNNSGTLTGGITVGQGEFPDPYQRNGATPNADPGSCNITATGGPLNIPTNAQEPYCFNLNVNVHNNAVTSNSSLGDELFSSTPAGAGGVTFCTGSDYYKFHYNWVCGNLSTGDGGGLAHLGFIYNGDIEHNQILFNQSTNPTVPTNGGGLAVLGAPDTDPVCGNEPDQDCAPGTSDGTGPDLVINANLIMGNSAESGSGGGIRFQGVNGTELTFFPTDPTRWYSVIVTNNIIANNVAGWDGAGVSLQDALVGELHQQHRHVQRHDCVGGSAVQYAGGAAVQQPAAADNHLHEYHLGTSAFRTGGHTEQPDPGDDVERVIAGALVPHHASELPNGVVPAAG